MKLFGVASYKIAFNFKNITVINNSMHSPLFGRSRGRGRGRDREFGRGRGYRKPYLPNTDGRGRGSLWQRDSDSETSESKSNSVVSVIERPTAKRDRLLPKPETGDESPDKQPEEPKVCSLDENLPKLETGDSLENGGNNLCIKCNKPFNFAEKKEKKDREIRKPVILTTRLS